MNVAKTVRGESRWVATFCAGLLIVAASVGVAKEHPPARRPPANRRNFVACPIVRDTDTLPCWLAEYQGELFYLGTQGRTSSAFYPPQLGHRALIEGTVVDGPRICGGVPLAPLAVSVMTELDGSCNTVLPAEAAFHAPPSPRAPIPSYPDTTRQLTILYDFDSDYLTLHDTRIVLEAVRIAKAIQPSRIDVRGYRGASLLSNGTTLVESAQIAEQRARKMVEALVGLGLAADRVHASWQTEPETPDGVNDPQRRRVTIALAP